MVHVSYTVPLIGDICSTNGAIVSTVYVLGVIVCPVFPAVSCTVAEYV